MADATDLLELLPAAVYTTDAQGRITFYNQAAARSIGAVETNASEKLIPRGSAICDYSDRLLGLWIA